MSKGPGSKRAAARKLRRRPTGSRHFGPPPRPGPQSNQPIYVAYNIEDAPVETTGFGGTAYDGTFGFLPTQTLHELRVDRRFRYIKWDGRQPRPIVEKRSRTVLGVLAGRPNCTPRRWNDCVKRMSAVLDSGRRELESHLTDSQMKGVKSTRGQFIALQAGYQYGNGRPHPMPCGQGYPLSVKEVLDEVTSDPNFEELAGFMSNSFRSYAPDLFKHYEETLAKLRHHRPDLVEPFLSSILPTVTVNLGPCTSCAPHRDSANLPFGLCGITSLGSFDPSKGGHLVLWELKLVVEFPPGSTILIPSSIIMHSNLPLGNPAQERRFSFTQYSSGELFRWVENGFRGHKSMFGTGAGAERAKSKHYENLDYAKKGFAMLAKYPS